MDVRRSTGAVAARPRVNFARRLKEIDMFFEGRGREHRALRRVVKLLEKKGIPYAIVGGMAVNAHGLERTTKDVDLLLNRAGFEQFRKAFVPRSYDPVAGRSRRFMDRQHQVTIDILVTGNYPGLGKPGPVAFPDPADVCERIHDYQVINLPTLIQLKLAARRYYDFGDVANLIRVHDLDESFQAHLHPSLQRDFIECLEEKRREDEYVAREERAEAQLQRDQPDEEE